jgi:SNF2 family DNA or RNA helicase
MSSYKSATRSHLREHELDRNIETMGEDEASEGSDLDIVKHTARQVNLLDTIQSSDNTDSDILLSDDSDRVVRKRPRDDDGDRIAFSDAEESDAAYEKFKSRKSDQRKVTAARSKKAKTKATAIVGKKKRAMLDAKQQDQRKFKTNNTYITDSEDEFPETTLPQFLKERKNTWDKDHLAKGEDALSKPPDYDGVYFSDDERLEELRERPMLRDIVPSQPYKDIYLEYSSGWIPAPIAQWLRDYQIQGTDFLHEHFVNQTGGILGDDMGLGKTIQVIAFLTAAFGKTGDERDLKRMRKMRRESRWYPKVLLICPGSLMANWQSEMDRWGFWHHDQYHGSASSRTSVLSAAKQGRLEVMITTYTTYRNHRDEINMVEWDCCIADECHQIKERSSEISKAMNEVNALCRIGLTGTAVQNKYDEFWTLLNWTNPGRFGTMAEWRTCISGPLKIGQSHDATNAQLATCRKVAEKLVKNLLPRWFRRRMKSLIAHQLPKKTDRVVFCPLSDSQSEAYMNLVDSDKIDYIRRSSDWCDCSSGKKRGWCCYSELPDRGKWQHHVFPMLMTLQKLSNHLALLCPQSKDSKDRHEKDLENLQAALPDNWLDMYNNRDQITNYANAEFCGKWKVLRKLLKFWHSNGDKVLVFSHSVRLLRMLQMLFKSTTSYNVSYLDGSMKYEERTQTVDDFNANETQFVFLISTKAGGVGLNITSANKVVIFDPNWNPSWDLQAQDRAYRIGQVRDVEVFRLVSAGTVEEIVYARQIYKQQQANIAYNASTERRYFRGVQDTANQKGEIFGLLNLFSFGGENLVLREIVNKTNIAESKAGVSVVGLDTSQDSDDENNNDNARGDRAMTQLAAEITGDAIPGKSNKALDDAQDTEAKRQSRAVQAILNMAGVEYTHDNSDVIGSSRMEAQLSKRAMAAGTDFDLSNEYAFEKSQEEQNLYNMMTTTMSNDVDEEKKMAYKYKPPEFVRKRLFCSIAAFYGFMDATEFALVLEGWSEQRKTDCLNRFYRHRREVLEGGGAAADV